MVKMNFRNPVLEKIVRRFKWTRNNTSQLFDKAEENEILDFKPSSSKQSKDDFQPVIYQFQCIITTTDTYYRKLINARDTQFGVFVDGEKILPKKELEKEMVKDALKTQIGQLEVLLKPYDEALLDRHIKTILTISDHEYLHQGELILMFREAGVDFPPRFKTAWAL